ncbi:MAG: GxxExxY protein [Bacteroidetes bacterium]|nr:GxxExxY protein [Bacteroidota bacterium]MBU2585397.1 GxxExxY protein [Bacteroidota bacterium]
MFIPLLTYLRFAKKEIGLLLNFNVLQLKNGIRKFVMTHSLP